MGAVGYDWLEGMQRVMRAEIKLDERWVEVIALHAALEAEINAMLLLSLEHGEFVTGNRPRITFGHKVAILQAAWKGKPEDVAKVCDILFSFNELRNAVAHPDLKKTEAEIGNTIRAYRSLVPDLPHEPSISEIAMGLVAFMGDGILPHDLEAIADGIDGLVNRRLPNALGAGSPEEAA